MNGYMKVIGMVLAATIMALAGGEGFRYARGDAQPPTAGDVRRNAEAIAVNVAVDGKEHREFYLAQASQEAQIEAIKETNASVDRRLEKIETAQYDQAVADAARETKFDIKLEQLEKQGDKILSAIENGP